MQRSSVVVRSDERGGRSWCFHLEAVRGPCVRSLSLALSLAITAASTAASTLGPEEKDHNHAHRFRVSVNMVGLSVTVLDQKGRLVRDLDAESFTVYEDGVEQEIEVFSREDLPLRMVILLDTSASMAQRLPLAQEAAIRFARSLKPEDRVSVIEFNERVLTLEDFTSDFDKVEDAIRRTAAGGSTSLYNGLYVALRSLAQRREGAERQAIVLLSDGADNHSLNSFEDVRDLARRTDVTVFGIGLLGPKPDLKSEENSNVRYVLEKLAAETGGSAFLPERIEDLAGVYDLVAAELKSQYNLAYTSTNGVSDGAWRRIEVLSDRPGVKVRTRAGYHAPRAASSTRRRARP